MATNNIAQQEIARLREALNEHNYRYYVLNQPTISDKEFDMMMKELEALETAHPALRTDDSPTCRVGVDRTEGFEQKRHQTPMLSLSNTYNYEEVADFYRRLANEVGVPTFDVVAELKFDGLSIALIYQDGLLTDAITRGDGQMGDVVTANVRTIRSVPLRLRGDDYPAYLEVRGEILLPFAEFERINREREEEGEPLFANPRNAASGTIKQLDPKVVAARRLDAYFYHVPDASGLPDSHYARLECLRRWGFKVSDAVTRCHSEQEIYDFLAKWDNERYTLPVATDGAVLKLDAISLQQKLGFTAKSPRWAIAYKYQAEQARTQLLSVDYQVGRTGAVTPVANLSPVQLSGTTVKRASLHNADFIAELNLCLHDYVFVEKGGEIIPKIVGVDEAERSADRTPVAFPALCPSCGTPLVRTPGEAAFYCPDSATCEPQQLGRIEHFCTRKAANINIGPETIELLYSHGLIKHIDDLYRLTEAQLVSLPGIREKSARKLLASIEESKHRPFHALLYGIGIRFVGETVARTLAKAFGSMEGLKNATEEVLVATPEIGPKIAGSIRVFFENEDNCALIDTLAALGLNFEMAPQSNDTAMPPSAQVLAGKTVVISGKFTEHSRDDYKQMVEALGGKMASSISGNTSFVLAGEDMGPSKRQKAEGLGVPLVSEADFLAMIASADADDPVDAPAAESKPTPSEEESPRDLFGDIEL